MVRPFVIIALGVGVGVLLAPSSAQDDERVREVKRLTDVAVQLRQAGKLDDAIAVWNKRLKLVRTIVGKEETESVAGSLEILADLYEAKEDYAHSEKVRGDVVKIRTAMAGEKHWKTVDARLAQRRAADMARLSGEDRAQLVEARRHAVKAFAAWKDKRFADALEHQAAVVRLHEKVFGESHPEVATGYYNLGSFAQQQGDLAVARRHLERAVNLRLSLLGETHPETARALLALGNADALLGLEVEAASSYERAFRAFRETLGEEEQETLIALRVLISQLHTAIDPGLARPYGELRLQWMLKAHGEEHPETAKARIGLGQSLAASGNMDAAVPQYREALGVYRRFHGKDHADIADCLMDLGRLYSAIDDEKTALRNFQEAYDMRRRLFGEQHADTFESSLQVAARIAPGSEKAAARLHYEDLLAAQRKKGERGPHFGATLRRYASLLEDLGEPARAEGALREALQVTAGPGAAAYDRASIELDLAGVLVAQNKFTEAFELTDRSRRTMTTVARRGLAGLGEADLLRHLHLTNRLRLHKALSLARARPDDAGIAERSAAWLLNAKALTIEILAERQLLLRDAAEEPLRSLGHELLAVRSQLSALSLAIPAASEEKARHERLAALANREEALTRKIAQVARVGVVKQTPGWVETAKVRDTLPADSVLIEFARFSVWRPATKDRRRYWELPHYAAWIIRRDTNVAHLVDLGDAGRIEKALGKVRQTLHEAAGPQGRLRQRGEVEAEKELRSALEELGKLVLTPLMPHIEASNWLLSPDGDLWLVPWTALPLADGKYVIEKHNVTLLVSGRDLLRPQLSGSSSAALVLADPDYDSANLEERPLESVPGVALQRGARRAPDVRAVRWPRLPGTAAEAEAVRPRLKALTGVEPEIHTGARAREAIFLSARRPSTVLLSTHGFFAEDADPAPSASERDGPEIRSFTAPFLSRPLKNPLLRCGLVLAGANQRQGGDGGDGLLSGLEILAADLRGTDLVVLSACDTGLGDVRVGEGVAGLRQAFQLAGASCVVATLWSVPDLESARLMDGFFAGLADGKSAAGALRDAQLAMIQSRRTRNGAAHPLYWAAFTLTGRGGMP